MLCEKCNKNQATVLYKENINGNTKSLALCSKCAAEQGEIQSFGKSSVVMSDSIADVFDDMNSLFGSLFGGKSKQLRKHISDDKKCTLCGARFSDLVKEGKAGCPECYRIFADELAPTVSRIHGGGAHTGMSPERFKEGRERKEKIAELESALKKAVEAEEYEEAAKLRDKLRDLKNEDSEK